MKKSCSVLLPPGPGYVQLKRSFGHPLVRFSDIEGKLKQEAIKIIIKYCDKYKTNYEKSAKKIGQQLTKYTSRPWNVVVGESFGIDFDYDPRTLLHLFYGPSTAICIWQSR